MKVETGGARNIGVDAGRLLMAALVILLHLSPPPEGSPVIFLLQCACRCAVPFFFLTSGYFLRIPAKLTAGVVIKPVVRLLPIYVFWMAICYGCAAMLGADDLSLNLRDVMFGGVAYHLWFLSSLGLALVVVPVSIVVVGRSFSLVLFALATCVVIATGAYNDVLGLPGEARRGGVLMAPLFVLVGHLFARRANLPSFPTATLIAGAGYAFLIVEELMIASLVGAPVVSHNFSMGIIVFGVGAFLAAQAAPASHTVRAVGRYGSYALGIYLSHVVFIWGVQHLTGAGSAASLLWQLPVVFGLAFALTAMLMRTGPTRRLVS